MALDRAVVAAGTAARDLGLASAQIGDEGGHRVVVRGGLRGARIESAAQDGHRLMIGGARVAGNRRTMRRMRTTAGVCTA